jgi:hypothetical protein
MKKKHTLVVTVVSEVDKGQRQMQDRLLRWIAAYGHTSVSFGFTFDTVGVLTGKRIHQVGGTIEEEIR